MARSPSDNRSILIALAGTVLIHFLLLFAAKYFLEYLRTPKSGNNFSFSLTSPPLLNGKKTTPVADLDTKRNVNSADQDQGNLSSGETSRSAVSRSSLPAETDATLTPLPSLTQNKSRATENKERGLVSVPSQSDIDSSSQTAITAPPMRRLQGAAKSRFFDILTKPPEKNDTLPSAENFPSASDFDRHKKQMPPLKKNSESVNTTVPSFSWRTNTPHRKTKPEKEIENFMPAEIASSMREGKPEKTLHEGIDYTLSEYNWDFASYIENWALALKKWWRMPSDYGSGKVPEGGSIWVRVTLSRDGALKNYKIYHTEVTPEMQLKVVQALTSSFARPALPQDYPRERLIVNWRFIYQPYGVLFESKKAP